MQITSLGASGGLESQQGTSAFHLPPHTLIDAGTGAQKLSMEELTPLHSVLLTHAHLDHISSLPLLIDMQFEALAEQQRSLSVYALPEVLETLKQHIFNEHIWPDFTRLPSAEAPVLRFSPITLWKSFTLPGEANIALQVTPFPLSHGVPTCGYCISDGTLKIAICGDTGLSETTIASLNRLGPLNRLVIECAFSNQLDALAKIGNHLTPQRLAALLDALDTLPEELWITHLKPNHRERIAVELCQQLPSHLNWTLPS
ncbi:3',5'-cyclic-nucleotide phosphodiesterase [Vreelandella populi]|uniref:3',5'-cyclic-nucleotide phosphodiesterase n=1 Tax=Vreelandella populi TaxID=2498858 RepID=UPI000F8E409E|nr:3',5'-cyclic-nucleotide phosphodiesterase [Halomonas populi]RUR57285.1 3',5'-cyclic-nucleotide phosphodiesterase [Halomonas populi]